MSTTQKNLLEDTYKEKIYTASHCLKAVDSFYASLKTVTQSKSKSLERQMIIQIRRLVRGERMSSDTFAPEGNLPSSSSHSKFYALKRLPIRGYCWQSTIRRNTYFISHYISKDFTKLKEQDIIKVHNNWYRIEVNGDER